MKELDPTLPWDHLQVQKVELREEGKGREKERRGRRRKDGKGRKKRV